MSKVEELIQQLCPEGVEYKKLGEVFQITRGRVMSKEYLRDNAGRYPVYSSQTANNGEIGKISTYDFDGEYLTWTTDGANAGTIFYRVGKFSITNVCGLLKAKSIGIIPKFAYYVLRIVMKNHVSSGMGNPKLMSNVVEKIQIPYPPLPIQKEIVSILDKFTTLEAELEAELEARRAQYEHYRNQLLNFEGKEVEWKKLGEVGNCYAGATPKTGVAEYWENGTIPWMSSGEVKKGKVFDTEMKITQKGYDNCSTKMVPANAVVIALAGQGKTRGTVAITRISLCTNQSLCSVIVEDEKVNSDYVFYYLKTQYQQLRSISSGDGTRGGLNLQMIKSYKIPIPPMKEQERIVSILDKFDALLNDISVGLPAEIEARHKQYEYYRGELLDFKNISNG